MKEIERKFGVSVISQELVFIKNRRRTQANISYRIGSRKKIWKANILLLTDNYFNALIRFFEVESKKQQQ